MKRTTGLSLCLVLLITLAPSLAPGAARQQSGGVFVGRGRVANKGARVERDSRPPAVEEDRAPRGEDEELKPMIGGRRLVEIEDLEHRCLDEVNRVREASGLTPFSFSEDLLKIARDYSRRMAEENFFAHTDPDGRTVRQRVDRANIRWRMIGENLAYSNGYTNPVAASMAGWMDSPGHRKNILDPQFRLTAIGAWISPNGTVYFTEIFLTR
jgi:uncharacterized protein YkwD